MFWENKSNENIDRSKMTLMKQTIPVILISQKCPEKSSLDGFGLTREKLNLKFTRFLKVKQKHLNKLHLTISN